MTEGARGADADGIIKVLSPASDNVEIPVTGGALPTEVEAIRRDALETIERLREECDSLDLGPEGPAVDTGIKFQQLTGGTIRGSGNGDILSSGSGARKGT